MENIVLGDIVAMIEAAVAEGEFEFFEFNAEQKRRVALIVKELVVYTAEASAMLVYSGVADKLGLDLEGLMEEMALPEKDVPVI